VKVEAEAQAETETTTKEQKNEFNKRCEHGHTHSAVSFLLKYIHVYVH